MKAWSSSSMLLFFAALELLIGVTDSFQFTSLLSQLIRRKTSSIVTIDWPLKLTVVNGRDCHSNIQSSPRRTSSSRRSVLQRVVIATTVSTGTVWPDHAGAASSTGSSRKCTDIESCRELGEQKVEKDMKDNPRVKLDNGVQYKVLRPGTDPADKIVSDGSTVDLIYSVSKPGAGYMYSQGFGYEKVDLLGDGKLQSDFGVDSLRVTLGNKDVPVGIEKALIGMKRGERRRVELPASVGFQTSNWKPDPTTKRGRATLSNYRNVVEGNGPNQPPFPAATIWDIEILKIRN